VDMKVNRILKFSTVGLINTLVDVAVFSMTANLMSVPAYAAQAAGYCAGMMNSFVMNKLWTFKKYKSDSALAQEILKFFTVNALSLAISVNAMWLLADTLKISYLISKALVLALTQAINYAGYKYWVFSG